MIRAILILFCFNLIFCCNAQNELREGLRKVSEIYPEDLDSALSLAYPILEKTKSQRNRDTVVLFQWWIGYLHKEKNQLDSAVLSYLEAIRWIEKYELEYGRLNHLYLQTGNVFKQAQAYDLAEKYYKIGKEKFVNTGEFRLIDFDHNLSGVYADQGKYHQAVDIARKILPLSERATYRYFLIQARKSTAHHYLNEFDSVIEINKKVLKELHEEYSYLKGGSYLKLALAYEGKKQFDSAVMNFEKSILETKKDSRVEPSKRFLVNRLNDFSKLYIKLEQLDKALPLLLEGARTINEIPEHRRNEEWFFELYSQLARVYSTFGNLEKAKLYEEKYEAELLLYKGLQKRYNMELIVQNYFDQIEEEERDASIKFYGGIASGGLMVLLTSIFIIGKIRASQTNRKLERNEAGKKLAELKALKAQINPHFLFNSLNSIQSFILEDKKNIADEYLVKYGKLIRKILDHSNELTVTLNDELEALQLYVELEQLRIKEGFAFEVIIQESIDPYNAMIPSMVIQPFIENAIWHGVSGLEGKGKIKLTISEHDDLVEVRVEDNGVGFDTDTDQNTSSKGVRLVRERLELLKETSGKESVVEMESEQGEGTTAILHFRNDLS